MLLDSLGGMFASKGQRLNNYPAHPAFIAGHDRNKNWQQVKKPGKFSGKRKGTAGPSGDRPCAVYSYVGPKLDIQL